MINIDDFVRDKLGGHTEKEDPAAWLRMKALLDKEMPEKAAPFVFRMGRPLVFIGVSLLVGILCVGGYQLNSIRQEDKLTSTTIKHSSSDHQTLNQAPLNTPATHQENIITKTDPITSENTTIIPNKQDSNSSTSKNIGIKSDSKVEHHSVSESKALSTIKNPITRKTEDAKQLVNNQKQNNIASLISDGSQLEDKKLNDKSSSNDHHKSIDKNNAIAQLNSFNASNETVDKADAHKEVNEHQSTGTNSVRKLVKNNANQQSNNRTEQQLDKSVAAHENPSEKNADQKVDSIPAITVVTKETSAKGFPRKVTTQVDTLGMSKVPAPQQKQSSGLAQDTDQNKKHLQNQQEEVNNNILAANNTAKEQASQKEQKKLNTQSKSKKNTIAKWINSINLSEAVDNVKRDIGNAEFFAGFTGGLNYSVSNSNNFQGVQFGPTGEIVFNKHWSLFGAVQYFNRSGGKKTVYDSYAKEVSSNNPDSTRGPNWFFTVHTDSTSRYFNFSTLHSFEMPITLRYAFNKFYLMTGINLAYYLKVNVEEVQKKYLNVNPHTVQTNASKPMLSESTAKLSSVDFGSKLGIGYIFGAGYQMTPSWQADLRIVNTFWNNAQTDGGKQLSQDFYKLPSVQISVGYQFNRGNTRPTFGPNSTP